MLKIKNTYIHSLNWAIKRSGLPKQTVEPNDDVYTLKELNRGATLGHAQSGSGHDNYLKGITVCFDLYYPEYFSPQLQRYGHIEIVSSQSKMHCLTEFDLTESCPHVDKDILDMVEDLKDTYMNDSSKENYYKLLNSLPMGFHKWMSIRTNYMQLKTIYFQRRHHKLPEWQTFCDWIEQLPNFGVLILNDKEK